MDWIGQFILILLIKLVSPASISSTAVIPLKNEELKTSNTYQVTENIKDIPDDRTLPPIIPNFGLTKPLNFGNNSLTANKVEEVNNGESTEENNTQDNEGKLKKHSFSILHIKSEYDDKPVTENHRNVLRKVLGGIKNYVYCLKKGVVDGLHSIFHHQEANEDDIKKETEFQNKFHNKFHRNFDSVEDFGDDHDYYDDDDDEIEEHLSHY